MKILKLNFVLIALIVLGIFFWAWRENQQTEIAPYQKSALQNHINECDMITEKAAAHLVAVVETQRLEIIGRKAHVFKRCMIDRGYAENPAWTKYATPTAEKNAKRVNASLDEAFENLRREKMVQFNAEKNVPLFWIKANK